MKKIYTLGFVLIVLLSMTMSATAMEYKEKTLTNFGFANAFWSNGNTNIYLDVIEGSIKGSEAETATLYVQICTVDSSSCKDKYTDIPANYFDISNGLNTATLSPVQVDLYDQLTGTLETFRIQVQWTGVGDKTTSSSITKEEFGDYRIVFGYDTTFRNAIATGTINGQELGTSQGANLARGENIYIQKIK